MVRSWSGRVATDIRDPQPDWAPFLQPVAPPGAPNVFMIVWDDVGYGALEPFGGPIETSTMHRGVGRLSRVLRSYPLRDRSDLRGAQRQGWNTYAVGEMASDAGGRMRRLVVEGPLAARPGDSNAFTVSSAARPTSGSPTWCTTTTPWIRRPPRNRAATCRRTWQTRRSARESWPGRRRSVCYPTTWSCRRSIRTANRTPPGPPGRPWPAVDFVCVLHQP